MPINLPPAVNYQSPLVAVPTRYGQDPREGPKLIACEINWATMGGAGQCVNFNLQNNTTLEFSQIVALSVDNSQCGADIQFVFPDTTETTTIPAYSPKTIIPVFTNQTQFFCLAQGALASDVTRFSIHNSLPPPIAVPTTQHQNVAANGGLNVINVASTQLIPTGINGTLEDIYGYYPASSSSAGAATWQLVDGASNVIAAGQITTSGSSTPSSASTFISLTNCAIRFTNGVKFQILTSTMVSGAAVASVTLGYRVP